MYASKTAFGKIRIRAWYCYLNKIAWREAVKKQSDAVSRAQGNVDKNFVGASKVLRKEKPKLERFLRNGLVFNPEFSLFLREREAMYVKENKLDNILELFSQQEWKVYSRAEQTPELMLVPKMDEKLFPGSQLVFDSGPYAIFNVFSASNLRDSVNYFLKSFKIIVDNLWCLNEAEKIKNLFKELAANDINNIPGEYRLRHLEELINHNFSIRSNSFTLEEKPPYIAINRLEEAWLRLALGYLKSKFLDNSMYFASVCFEHGALQIISEDFGIQVYRWFSKEKKDKENILSEFYNLLEFMKDHPNYSDQLLDLGIDYEEGLGQY